MGIEMEDVTGKPVSKADLMQARQVVEKHIVIGLGKIPLELFMELTTIHKALKELEKPTAAEDEGRRHDADTLKAAYQQRLEEAKKIILDDIQKLAK
jgi:hypothetical protein